MAKAARCRPLKLYRPGGSIAQYGREMPRIGKIMPIFGRNRGPFAVPASYVNFAH
jgi:hypothetical protein